MLRQRLAACYADEAGVSAVEFGFIGPILALALIMMVDLGLAAHERIAIDHVLRAGSEGAMAELESTAVLQIMRTTAEQNFKLLDPSASATAQQAQLSLAAHRFCACTSNLAVEVSCTSTTACPANTRRTFHRLSASKSYTGMLVPTMNFSSSTQVQLQ
jgi:Flp pilus assembly protein TadG